MHKQIYYNNWFLQLNIILVCLILVFNKCCNKVPKDDTNYLCIKTKYIIPIYSWLRSKSKIVKIYDLNIIYL